MGAYHSFSPLSFIISISMFREAADARLFVQYAPALHPLVENDPVIYIQRNTRGGGVNWARNWALLTYTCSDIFLDCN
jgi:hypothetical protein